MNEETFMTYFIEDISTSTKDASTQGLSGQRAMSQGGKGST